MNSFTPPQGHIAPQAYRAHGHIANSVRNSISLVNQL